MKQYPFIFSNERKFRLARHITFWFVWWAFSSILYSYTNGISLLPSFQRLPVASFDAFFYLIPHMFLSYTLMYFVIPRFVFKGKYLIALFLMPVLFFLTAFISALIGIYFLNYFHVICLGGQYMTAYQTTAAFFLSLLAGLRGGLTIGGLAAAIKLMKYWYMKEQRNLQLQKENAESQLQLLKAQVHPHFLFNTLNNIYSHTQNTSTVASNLVTGLSDLLRYILYECNQPLVPLAKELKLLRDYARLEQVRYGNHLVLQMDIPEQTNDLYIAPLLLLPLLENCFKHGTSNMIDQPWISLHISVQDNILRMKLINGKEPETKVSEKQSGIGILNVQKRLSLLYENKHDFIITSDADVYIVNLQVELHQQKELSLRPAYPEQVAYA